MINKKRTVIFSLVFLTLFAFSSPCMAAQRALVQCMVKPPQAKAVPILTNWQGTVKHRLSVAGRGKWEYVNFVVQPDGYIQHWFNRPRRGIDFEAVITIHGGWAYHDSAIHIRWLGEWKEPEITILRNVKWWHNGYDPNNKDIIRYGATFYMKRK